MSRRLKAAGFLEVRVRQRQPSAAETPGHGQRGLGGRSHEERRRTAGQSYPARGGCRMTMLYPIVLETEDNSAVSATRSSERRRSRCRSDHCESAYADSLTPASSAADSSAGTVYAA